MIELLERKLNWIKGFIKVQPLNLNTKKLTIPFSIFLALTIYLACFSNHAILWSIISVLIAIFVIMHPKYLLISILTFAIALLVHMLTLQVGTSEYVSKNYKVIEVLKHGFIIEDGHTRVYVNNRITTHVGDVVHVKGKIEQIRNTGSFDAITYYKSMNVVNSIQFSKVAIISRSTDFRVAINNYITEGNAEYTSLTPLMLMGIKDEMTSGIYSKAIEMNVVHIFVISGFHMSLLYLVLKNLLMKCKLKEDLSSWFATIPLFVYLILLNFQISATRAFLLIIFSVINKTILKKRFTGIELISFVMALMFMWKPYSIYSLSFILTFLATFFIFIISKIKIENKILKLLFISFAVYSINLPINVFINKRITLMGPIFSLVITPVFTLIFIISGFLFPFKEALGKVNVIFIWFIDVISYINITLDTREISLDNTLSIYATLFVMCWIPIFGYGVYEKRGKLLFWKDYLISLIK